MDAAGDGVADAVAAAALVHVSAALLRGALSFAGTDEQVAAWLDAFTTMPDYEYRSVALTRVADVLQRVQTVKVVASLNTDWEDMRAAGSKAVQVLLSACVCSCDDDVDGVDFMVYLAEYAFRDADCNKHVATVLRDELGPVVAALLECRINADANRLQEVIDADDVYGA